MSFAKFLLFLLTTCSALVFAKEQVTSFDVFDLKRNSELRIGLVGERSLLLFIKATESEIQSRVKEIANKANSDAAFKNTKMIFILDNSGMKIKNIGRLIKTSPVEVFVDKSGGMKKQFQLSEETGAVLVGDNGLPLQVAKISNFTEIDFSKDLEFNSKAGGK